MPMPKVTTSVVDLTTRVSATGTYNSAIVVAAKKGPIDIPTLVTSQTDFLERFTPNETLQIGWDTALYEAYIYLSQHSNLYVVRTADTTSDTPALYGGAHIRTYKSEKTNTSIDKGFLDVVEHTYNGEGGVPDVTTKHYDTPDDIIDLENDAFVIYGSSQGAWNNDLAVTIVTDPDKVKLDGAFILNVYKNKSLVETWTCSLDPSLKNGYGINCYVETVLKASNYVRADVSDAEDILKEISYGLKVVGKVNFENEVVKAIQSALTLDSIKMTRLQGYVKGDIRWVNDQNGGLEGAYGYYKCTTAGTTTSDDTMPIFTENGKYKVKVLDGTVVWELQEIIKEHSKDTDYSAGEIVKVENGANALYYRALVSGTTSQTLPEFKGNEVIDGTITWEAQVQSVETFQSEGYTPIKKAVNAKFDIETYPVYKDVYLATKLEMPKTVTVANPIRTVDWTTGTVKMVNEEKAVEYIATYNGEASEEHYCLPKACTELVKFAGGFDGTEPTTGDRIRALKTLGNINDINIQLVMDGGYTTPEYHRAIDDLCNTREMSCKGIISTPYVNEMGMVTGDSQKDVVDYRKYQLNANTRNLELYTTHQLVYDEFNDRNIYVSPSCFVAARIMSVAQEYGWHWAAAGYNRGVINSLDVAKTFDPSVVDTFSDAQINTIIKEPGMGNVIFDELTLLSKSSDLQDSHNARYIDVYLRPRLKDALKQFLFEFNDEQTRMLITKMLETFMTPEIASRAIYNYQIVCDNSNNTNRDIQNNICNVWIFVQLMHLAKWIPIKLICTPYGTDFADLDYKG